MADQQDPPVGYKSPPKHGQFRKGGPQPKRRAKTGGAIDVHTMLSEPVKVGEGRAVKKMQAFELSFLLICQAAIKGEMRATEIAMKFLHRYGIIGAEIVQSEWPDVLRVPIDYEPNEWYEHLKQFGPPPWPLEHDGLPRIQELRDAVGR